MKTNRIKKFICALSLILAASVSFGAPPAAASDYIGTTAVNLNSSPVAENLELSTYREVSVNGYFSCLDPEGDPVTYSIVKNPKKGTLEIDGDTFTYTPSKGKKGKDTFTYVAIDSAGNVSNTATVTINIKKQSTNVSYSDMTENSSWYASLVLAENGIFVGEQVGGEYLFRPDVPVSRGEFLVMCLKVSGTSPLEGITRTGFYDDAVIPCWQKPYVSAALIDNVISGRALGDGRVVFSANDEITFAEATVMLNNALGITDVYSPDGDSKAAPAWAYQASLNLSSCDIIRDVSIGVSSGTLTRADAANMLVRAMDVLNTRSSGGSLLSWAE